MLQYTLFLTGKILVFRLYTLKIHLELLKLKQFSKECRFTYSLKTTLILINQWRVHLLDIEGDRFDMILYNANLMKREIFYSHMFKRQSLDSLLLHPQFLLLIMCSLMWKDIYRNLKHVFNIISFTKISNHIMI